MATPLHEDRWRRLQVRMRPEVYERFAQMALEADREPWEHARVILERAARRWKPRDLPERAA